MSTDVFTNVLELSKRCLTHRYYFRSTSGRRSERRICISKHSRRHSQLSAVKKKHFCQKWASKIKILHNTFAIFQKFKIFWPKMTIFFVINNTSVLSFENGNWQGTSRLAFDRSSEWLPELNVRFVSPFYRLHNKNFVWVVWNTRPFVAMKKRRFEIISHGQLKFEVWTWPYGSTYAF